MMSEGTGGRRAQPIPDDAPRWRSSITRACPVTRRTVPPRQTERFERRLLGKPMRWSRGSSAVLVVWLLVGAGLLAARLDMGHLTAWSAREAAAVAQVRAFKPDGVHRTDELLDVVARELALREVGRPQGPRWYAFERSWEDRVYVVWEWSEGAVLWFTVHGGEVRPDDEARLILRTVARSLPSR
jgi:hypothetical protein